MTSPAGTMTFIGSRETDKPTRPAESCCSLSPTGSHHWYIEPNQGKTSDGKCRYCKTKRTFYNWFDVMYRGDGVGDGNVMTEEI